MYTGYKLSEANGHFYTLLFIRIKKRCFNFSVYRDLKWKASIVKENPESLISHPVSVFRLVSQLYEFFVETFHACFHKSYAEGMNIFMLIYHFIMIMNIHFMKVYLVAYA